MDDGIVIESALFLWTPEPPATASWHFIRVTGGAADQVRAAAMEARAAGLARGFGSVRVAATIGGMAFHTSLFPHRETGGYLLPVKAEVRRREGIVAGETVRVRLRIV
ncbi:DUF1905 domain-containing protein [Sphingosinicella sp. LHD-64]|uniref:DUF1905 domain-containing protein n=1 Tax=Sphingosinicella sp. LHD-64 TaxID=3072139 RepID=UPI00280FA89A|nr:DUF1905 domain-containing protein [Sphingosinicella sp. LHD-64]MDQ8755876.1 DUF1905 domain-containing protein [Sphingosinicella sp. LHD-64]